MERLNRVRYQRVPYAVLSMQRSVYGLRVSMKSANGQENKGGQHTIFLATSLWSHIVSNSRRAAIKPSKPGR